MLKRRWIHFKNRKYWRAARKQYLPDTEGLMHTWTQSDCDTQDQDKCLSDKVPTLREGSRCKVPPIMKRLFAIYTCWERKNPMNCYLFFNGPLLITEVVGQDKANSTIWSVWFFSLLDNGSFGLFYFGFFFEKKTRNREVAWVRGCRRSMEKMGIIKLFWLDDFC